MFDRQLGRRDLFFFVPLLFFTYPSRFTFFLCVILLLLFSCASVWENKREWVPYFLLPYLVLVFFLRGEIVLTSDEASPLRNKKL